MKYNLSVKDPSLFVNTNGFLVFALFMCYSFALTFTCFACVSLSAFLVRYTNRYELCALLAMLYWFIHPIVLYFVSYNNIYTDPIMKILILLLPNVCVFLGIHVLVHYEQMGGLTFGYLFTPVSTLTSYPSMGILMMILLIDAGLFFGIAWYFSWILPSEYSINRPWYFPFQKHFWITQKIIQVPEEEVPPLKKNFIAEPPPKFTEASIQVRHLNKAFGEARHLITDLSFDVYEEQLTVILGRDKVGKSTIVDMITGK